MSITRKAQDGALPIAGTCREPYTAAHGFGRAQSTINKRSMNLVFSIVPQGNDRAHEAAYLRCRGRTMVSGAYEPSGAAMAAVERGAGSPVRWMGRGAEQVQAARRSYCEKCHLRHGPGQSGAECGIGAPVSRIGLRDTRLSFARQGIGPVMGDVPKQVAPDATWQGFFTPMPFIAP